RRGHATSAARDGLRLRPGVLSRQAGTGCGLCRQTRRAADRRFARAVRRWLTGPSRLLRKCLPALSQPAESGTRPYSASPDQALEVLDPRRAIHGPHSRAFLNTLLAPVEKCQHLFGAFPRVPDMQVMRPSNVLDADGG